MAVALVFVCGYLRMHRVMVGLWLFPTIFVTEFMGKALVAQPIDSHYAVFHQLPAAQPAGAMLGIALLGAAVLLVVAVLVRLLWRRHHLLLGLSLLAIVVVATAWGALPGLRHGSLWPVIRNHELAVPIRWLLSQMDNSFPSGHTARATYICLTVWAMFLAQRPGRMTRWLATLIALLFLTTVSLSMLVLRYHWFSDVLGGLILGATMASLTEFANDFSLRCVQKQPSSLPTRGEEWAGGGRNVP
jgi:membrane-associated phospholipid phosphatase